MSFFCDFLFFFGGGRGGFLFFLGRVTFVFAWDVVIFLGT